MIKKIIKLYYNYTSIHMYAPVDKERTVPWQEYIELQ